MASREELQQLPRHYRWLLKLILKLPNPGLPYFILRIFPEVEGIFWAMIVPVLLVLYFFFDVWLLTFLSRYFIFPVNIIMGLLIPAVVFLFFLRIQLERTILLLRNIHERSNEWEVSHKVEEFVELLKIQRRRK